ncbi:hypothetical protein D3C85_1630760 [compost metagenome]
MNTFFAHVVIVTGVVERVLEIGFVRVDGHHVQTVVLPQIQPGVKFALIEQIAFEVNQRHGGKEFRFWRHHCSLSVISFFHCW